MKNTASKILLVGGNGLLGSSLEPYLKLNGHETISVSRTSKDFAADFTSAPDTNEALDSLRPDVILNLAAHTNVDLCEQDPESAYLLNKTIPENISHWCDKNKNTHFIHISTDMVYDSEGFNNENNTKVCNQYAGSKLAGEFSIKNESATILRTNFFGMSHSPLRRSFTDWIYDNISQQKKINVLTDVDFSPISLRSLNEVILHVIMNPRPGTYNLGSKSKMSKADFCRHFVNKLFPEHLNLLAPVTLTQLNLKAPRPHLMAMNSELFEKTFNFKLKTLEQEINLTLEDYKK